MDINIFCPNCNTDLNSYKCEHTCNFCDTIYCLTCSKPFHIINDISHKGHKKNCYNNIKSKL